MFTKHAVPRHPLLCKKTKQRRDSTTTLINHQTSPNEQPPAFSHNETNETGSWHIRGPSPCFVFRRQTKRGPSNAEPTVRLKITTASPENRSSVTPLLRRSMKRDEGCKRKGKLLLKLGVAPENLPRSVLKPRRGL